MDRWTSAAVTLRCDWKINTPRPFRSYFEIYQNGHTDGRGNVSSFAIMLIIHTQLTGAALGYPAECAALGGGGGG